MGRKGTPALDEPIELEARDITPRRVNATRQAARGGSRRDWRGGALLVLGSAATAAAVVVGLLAAFQIEQFVRNDRQFALVPPPAVGGETPSVQVDGLQNASRQEILTLFERDFGRSLWRLPVWQRREELRRLPWIQDATLRRVWPNQLHIRVVERTPVAFAQLPTGNANALYRTALVDVDGVILRQSRPAKLDLPVLLGLYVAESRESRARKIQAGLRLVEEAGTLNEGISEIDVSEPDNLKITQQVDDRAILLILGRDKFAAKLRRFHASYGEIIRRAPDASVLDLRIENQVIDIRIPVETAPAPTAPPARRAPAHGR